MPHLAVYQLAFRTGLHVGLAGGKADESGMTLSAGTLFAAILDAARRMGADPNAIVAPFPHVISGTVATPTTDLPWLLTSAFPYAGAVPFYPMPIPLQTILSAEILRRRHKDLKRVRFVSERIFREMLAGRSMDTWLFPEQADGGRTRGAALQAGTFWMAWDEFDGLPADLKPLRGRHALSLRHVYRQESVPRVTVTRAANAGELYHTGRVTFAEGCGLWFGIDWRHPDGAIADGRGSTWRSAFEGALNVLQDDGLGGERSAGYGAFTWSNRSTLDLPDPVPGEPMVLLSRYHPRAEETTASLAGDAAAYELVPVSGWLRTWDGAAQRRRRLWTIEAGSVVRATREPQGDLTDVRPTYGNPAGAVPHPVWRWGIALGVRWGGGA